MPVITLYYDRMLSKLKHHRLSKRDLVDALPYLGLDLEEEARDYVRVEYNPNRPDFSSEWGVARALNGLLGFEKGAPHYSVGESDVTLKVDESILRIRPVFIGAVVRGLKFDDESIKQLMVMQDDLDNGIGRRRSKVSTGLHNLDAAKPPFKYWAAPPDLTFTPLGYNKEMSLKQILSEVETGQKYRHIVEGFSTYPIITDSKDRVISFPPIINSDLTRVSTETRNLFIDITATNLKAAEDVLAVLMAALSDQGGLIESVKVHYSAGRHWSYTPEKGRIVSTVHYPAAVKMITPDLTPTKMSVEPAFINNLLGLELKPANIVEYLGRSRLTAKIVSKDRVRVEIPRYRSDILHPVDLVEEVAIGYNIANLTPTLPETADIGRLNDLLKRLDSARDVLIGLGLMEVLNFSLISRETLLGDERLHLKVKNPKTGEHEYLRGSLIPSVLTTLSGNTHEEYPQRLFEVGKVFIKSSENPIGVKEEYHVAVAIAHANANYTEAKSYLTSFISQLKGLTCNTRSIEDTVYIPGRAAEVDVEGRVVGKIGEVTPSMLEIFSLRVPVSIFELNLELV